MPAPGPPRRRLVAAISISADSTTDLAAHLLNLAADLYSDDGPESVDRYTVTDGAASHVLVAVDPAVTAESYRAALQDWARDIQADHRAADDDWELF